jgi:hypothetical protein
MSQSVQLDMEVLQRIKFLMEYDVMKTSSENILLEQDLGLKGKTIAPGAKPPAGFGHGANSGPKTLEELTVEVRTFMSDWKTATVETLATLLGVGIPVVVTANGFWLTLEVIQAVKGNPDYLSLIFAFIATATAGSQSVVLKPLYSAVGKILKGSGKSVVEIFDAIYTAAKNLGLWDKLKPILEGIKSVSKATIDGVTTVLKWLNDNVLWIFKGATWLGKEIMGMLSSIKTFISGLFNAMDNWLANIGTRAGLKPQVAQQIGKATRWGTVPFAIHKGVQLYNQQSNDTTPILTKQQMDNLPYDAQKWKF